MFMSIDAPLSSIAFMIASSDSGMAPRWNAKPSMKELVAMLSPINAVARPVASSTSRSAALTASLSESRIAPAWKSISGSITKLAVGSRSALTTARVTPRSARLSAGIEVATTMSQPRMRLALPGPMRTLARSSADGAMRTWLMTAPFFCDKPVKSSVEQALPST